MYVFWTQLEAWNFNSESDTSGPNLGSAISSLLEQIIWLQWDWIGFSLKYGSSLIHRNGVKTKFDSKCSIPGKVPWTSEAFAKK